MKDQEFFKGSHNPLNFFRSLAFDIRFLRSNPMYFDPCGIWLFCGAQGEGKSLSMVKCCKQLLDFYPSAMVCSNLQINGIEQEVIPFTDYSQITTLSNGIKGIIFVIDEMQVLWNSLESKDIPFSEMAAFAQMRKDRRIILGSSQVYYRVAKPVREQLRYVVKCRNVLKYLQINQIIDPNADGYTGEHDGELEGEHIATEWFFHSPEDYQSYDTLNKISRLERKKVKK